MTNYRISLKKVCAVFLLAACVLFSSTANADKKGKSKNHHNGGGHSNLSISPYGIGYSYHDSNFGISIGRGGFGFAPAAPFVPVDPPVVSYPVPLNSYYPLPAPPAYAPPYGYHENFEPGMPTDPNPFESQVVPSVPTLGPAAPNDPSGEGTDRLTSAIPTNLAASKFESRAETEFRAGNYQDARRYVDYALLEDNSNGHLLLFASHVSMAMEDYERASIELGAAIQRLHQNEWDFFVRDSQYWYPAHEYGQQVKKLVTFCETQNLDFGFVLRGFHRACVGQTELAHQDFRNALAINPENTLAQRLQSRLQVQRPRINTLSPPPSRNAIPADPGLTAPMTGAPVEVPAQPQNRSQKRSILNGVK